MSAAAVYEQFIRLSGRKDLELENPQGTPRAFEFINTGQRWLDDRLDPQELLQIFDFTLGAGDTDLTLAESVRYLEWLQVLDTAGWRELEQWPLKEFRLQPFTAPDPLPGSPRAYALDQENLVHIAPQADKEYQVKVRAAVYSPYLEDDPSSSSWWSDRYPMLLTHAACYQLELSYRNTQGANDWLMGIERMLINLDRNEVSRELSHGRRVMWG